MKNSIKAHNDVCDHVIGLLRHTDYSELVNLQRLNEHIQYRTEWNDMIRNDPNFINLQHFMMPVFTLQHYGDFRRNTNLTKFKHCPECGAKIDWKAIKQTES